MERVVCPFTARATWAGEVVAESSSAIRVELADQPPLLFFPLEDVRLGAFHRDEGAGGLVPSHRG